MNDLIHIVTLVVFGFFECDCLGIIGHCGYERRMSTIYSPTPHASRLVQHAVISF